MAMTRFVTGGVPTIGRGGGGSGRGMTTIIHETDSSLVLDLQFARDAAFTSRRGPLPTFTRASQGWRVNSSGIIVPAAINEARIDYDPTTLACLGIKNEPQSTNLLSWSEDLTNGVWIPTNLTVTANQGVAPDGFVTADLVAETTANSGHYIRSDLPVVTLGVVYTASIFLKKGSGVTAPDWVAVAFTAGGFASQAVAFNVSTGAFGVSSGSLTYSAKQYANGCWRVSATVTATATAVGGMFVSFTNNTNATAASYAGQTTSNVFVWGAQLEALDHATSYIPTTSAAVVRSADLFSYTGGAFSGFWNASEGTIVFQGMNGGFNAAGQQVYASATDGTANNRNLLRHIPSFETYSVVSGGASQVPIVIAGVALNTAFGMAIRYKANDFAVSVSGGVASTDTSGTVPAATQLGIGNENGASPFTGWIRSVQYYNRIKTNAQLQTLSTP